MVITKFTSVLYEKKGIEDAEHRLVSVKSGNRLTELKYDGLGRCVIISHWVDGSEVESRRLVWCGANICEEHTQDGIVRKRFFDQGMQLIDEPTTNSFFYTRDHLGSIKDLIDVKTGNVVVRYDYDPFGHRTRLDGAEFETDFGFAGMFWIPEVGLNLTWFRAYDPTIGRWLSRDQLDNAEMEEGPNLYAYVQNNPINRIDSIGLYCCEDEWKVLKEAYTEADALERLRNIIAEECLELLKSGFLKLSSACYSVVGAIDIRLEELYTEVRKTNKEYFKCMSKPYNSSCPYVF